VASEARNYTEGTKRALFRLARGTCYFPKCLKPVIEVVEGEPVVAMEIAHIRGAHKGSARFDESMTDEERALFGNLILLCSTHHKLVDRLHPGDYSVETLEQWKRENEPVDGLKIVKDLSTLTETDLENVLVRLMSHAESVRTIEVALHPLLMFSGMDALMASFDDLPALLAANEGLRQNEKSVCASIRNVGLTDVSIEFITVHYTLKEADEKGEKRDISFHNINKYENVNPQLPHRLLGGESVNWLLSDYMLQLMHWCGPDGLGRPISSIYATVGLASGETFESDRVPRSRLDPLL
jgi:hypothetical protein